MFVLLSWTPPTVVALCDPYHQQPAWTGRHTTGHGSAVNVLQVPCGFGGGACASHNPAPTVEGNGYQGPNQPAED